MLSRLSITLLGALALASCGPPPPPQPPLVERQACAPDVTVVEFGISASGAQESLEQQWKPLLAAMTDSIGRPVTGFYATDSADVIEAMRANKIQAAWFDGASYVEAAQRSRAEVFVAAVDTGGSQGYTSHLITHRESPLLTRIDAEAGDGDEYVVENARDLTFAFDDLSSTPGYLVPMLYIFLENGIDPDTAFRELQFSGSPEAAALAIANQQVDIATSDSKTLAALAQSNPEVRGDIQVIWTSPLIPTDPIAYQRDLPDCLKQDLQAFFSDYSTSDVLEPIGWAGFEPTEDKAWNSVRELDIANQILEMKGDPNLGEDIKRRDIEALNIQLEALRRGE